VVEALLMVVELNGPTMMSRIGMLRALNRHVQREFNPSRKETPAYTGVDFIIARDGKIAALYVYLDSPPT
jgi:hypothetical protein